MRQNIIIALLLVLVILQLVSVKHSHDNSYRLSSIVKHSANASNDINYILNKFEDTEIPINLCLDPDHGDLESKDSKDYEPYGLLKKYLPYSSQLHLKQTSLDKRKNGPFTEENNKSGLIDGNKVAALLSELIPDERKKDFEIILKKKNEIFITSKFKLFLSMDLKYSTDAKFIRYLLGVSSLICFVILSSQNS